MKKLLLLLLAFPLLFFSCGNDETDTERPQILNLEPEENELLQIGKNIHFTSEITDNEGLKSYKIDIHGNFDNHGHKSAQKNDSIEYSFVKVWYHDKENGISLEGLKNVNLHHHEIEIPKEKDGKPVRAGKYHFILYVYDRAGNETMLVRNVALTYDEVEEHDH